MSNQIEVGDTVTVNFNGSMMTLCLSAVVDHVPVATGDSWIFTESSTGKVHYVSEGCTVTKVYK